MGQLLLRIVGTHLPGSQCAGYDGIQVGVQRGGQTVELRSADAAQVIFELPVDAVRTAMGGLDFHGPFVHGSRDERFLYLVWTHPGLDGEPQMFRRAKLMLGPLSELNPSHADESVVVVQATLDLTDARGGPVCAAVRPPHIGWQLL